MRTPLLLLSIFLCLAGCARKSELQATRADLAEARRKIAQLEADRVPRIECDVTKASLKLADERISELERELQSTREKLAATQLSIAPAVPAENNLPPPTALAVSRGTSEVSNETLVHSPDAQLNFGSHLQITSPTGLMVTDPDLRVVGGDLSIKSKGMTMETSDGLLATQADGSVKFVGNSMTMKFDPAGPQPAPQPGSSSTPPPTDTNSPATPPAEVTPDAATSKVQ